MTITHPSPGQLQNGDGGSLLSYVATCNDYTVAGSYVWVKKYGTEIYEYTGYADVLVDIQLSSSFPKNANWNSDATNR